MLNQLSHPFVVFGQNFGREILGRRNPPRQGSTPDENRFFDYYQVFAWAFGVYSLFHLSYLLFYGGNISYWLVPYLLLSIFVVFRPWATYLFATLVLVRLIEMWVQMPSTSNHAIIDFFLLFGLVITGLAALLQKRSWNGYVYLFAPIGRLLLLIMYFYGIFHKLNTDFLNPESSCAVFLWQQYPFPAFITDGLWAHYLAIYGTFIFEGLIMIGLCFRQTRYVAVIAGVGFHVFLGLSTNAYYGPFSFLSLMLHALFLPTSFLEHLRASRIYQYYLRFKAIVNTIVFLWIILLIAAALYHNHIALILLFLLIAGPFFIAVILYGKEVDHNAFGWTLRQTGPIAVFVAVVFAINNALPYTGLKTHQALNMFSNLHLDATRTNHLIIRQPPTLFPYLAGIIHLRSVTYPGQDAENTEGNLGFVYHEFLRIVQDTELKRGIKGVKYTFELDGNIYQNLTYADFKKDIDRFLLPWYVRKFVHFEGIDRRQPRPCLPYK